MNKYKYSTLLLASMAMVGSAFAQQTQDDEAPDLSATVVKVNTYRPTISDAKKLREAPSTIDTTLPKPSPSYIYGNDPLELTYVPDSIKAARMKGEPLDPLYRGYTKLGGGNGINYMGDLYLNAVRSRKGALGLELHGRGTQGIMNDLPPAPYHRWNAQATGKRFLKRHALDYQLGYDLERLQYYGYDLSDPASLGMYNELIDQNNGDEKAIIQQFQQRYQRINAGIGLKSFYSDSAKLNHEFALKYDRWMDRDLRNSEDNIVFNGGVNRYFGAHQLNIEAGADYNRVNYLDSFNYGSSGDIAKINNNTIISLKPYMVSQWKKLRVEYGAMAQAEVSAAGTNLRLYPHAYARYNLVKEIIIPYAGVGGGMQRNNLNKLTETNPFLWPSLTALKNTDEVYRVYGGFRGAFTKRVTYNLQGARYQQRDVPLFVNYNATSFNPGLSRFGENYFLVNYDTLNVVEIKGELMYRVGEKLQILGMGSYKSFQTTAEFKAWHMPNIEASIVAFYQIKNKLIGKAQMHFYGPQLAKSYESEGNDFVGNDGMEVYSETIAPIADINLGVEYRYTERLSGFLNINNVIAQRYQRWNQYPAQRINVMGGITFSFWKE